MTYISIWRVSHSTQPVLQTALIGPTGGVFNVRPTFLPDDGYVRWRMIVLIILLRLQMLVVRAHVAHVQYPVYPPTTAAEVVQLLLVGGRILIIVRAPPGLHCPAATGCGEAS